jgi:TorA maturation chaperone TorD
MTNGRWELLRALGAIADSPADARTASAPLGLDLIGDAEHTEVFVLNCPPYASVYLGPEGGLGGEGTDRVAGFWRAIGITPPAEPDHLAALLGLYASLGEAAADTRQASTADALARARRALYREHLGPWLPGYLDAVADLATPVLPGWAELTRKAITAESADGNAGGPLPLALRGAPPPLSSDCGLGEMLDAIIAPVRSGLIITRRRLARGAGHAGAGHRIGERRFTLRAMLEQAPASTLGWLRDEARQWSRRHAARAASDTSAGWWAARAGQSARVLAAAAAAARETTGASHGR